MPDDLYLPTLAELLGLFRLAKHAKGEQISTTGGSGQSIRISFEVSHEDLAEAGISFMAIPSSILASLLVHLGRLAEIDSLTEVYRDTERKGATSADCQAFINNELKNVSPGSDILSTIQRRMYNTVLQKLVELSAWRAAVDAQRFQNQREAERKRQAEQKRRDEEILRETAAQRKRDEELAAKRREEERKNKYYGHGEDPGSWNGVDWATDERVKRAFEDLFNHYSGKGGSFSDMFGDSAKRNNYKDEGFSYRDPKQSSSKRSWFEILGVPAGADKATIKSAWRRLAKINHPDRCKDAGASARMAEINAAKDEGLAIFS